ncbi:CDP-alcohol phosphatidyltransferase family protein [bacterium endosymbiont of Bathymodiolus sp. 5 South]|jgi:cardiolipin synthase|uniref:CDP-alcohol phosphatidyltransferase family protein n=1 Tax=bacterium endosymbiont of Bathymodiolus sp. 5 South TaxID=1181670 RepID=UPI000255FECD|nr:CDP-alcohol phosphatidyltransferase family protein [bacterium endosymbiont of Bathymodiolus sp. 5 South]CAC9640855.1 CDP-diacylglycerol--glycerol-3-phosphate 3-phosphatidyltransferase (EC 2.7.8.5) [uncultured Gammaproteobacteria bacterium]CAC9643181.1 CDP-diacylglycerol--glycerol-3-phosphate 3-phosphatidyltransferase (EC 2.7.8.5) [uncultured Gammaproteobacteria bacterium]CAC9655415.1 CDP-diacylglycerol--glycerol-3-phosphate 3-phosphatidyltransferase (EC 2.7.8.5) [uncultured Gammaproteobacteri
MNLSSLPNALSILRIILTVPVVLTLLNEDFFLAMMLFFIAGITDALDGWVAKRYSCQTRLGSILDPVADKLLLVSSFIALSIIGLLPLWLLLLIFLRDLMIVSGTVGSFMGNGESDNHLLMPSKLSKINTALQIALVLFLVTTKLYPILSEWSTVFFITIATSTVLSGIDYIWIWFEKAISQEKQKQK